MSDWMPPLDFDPGRASTGTVPGPRRGLLYPIKALVRDGEAGYRSFVSSRRFVRIVAEFDEHSFGAINIYSTPDPGRLSGSIELHGPAADEVTVDDLNALLGEAVFLGEPSEIEQDCDPQIVTAFELTRTLVTPLFRPAEDASRPTWASREDQFDGPGYSTPQPNEGDSAETLLASMARTGQRLWVRTIIAPADELSRRIVVDELNSAMPRQVLADYARIPVKVRTMVSSSGTVPAAVRAALRQRGVALAVTALDAEEARKFWTAPLDALAAAAVGETHALALTRIPTAGAEKLLGMATRRPPVPDRPLDPMPPAAANPIRLGWAIDAFGQRADVELDVQDLIRHIFIEGASGSGKTTTIAQLYWSIVHAGYQVIYLDPHGDGAARAAAYSSLMTPSQTHYIRHGNRAHPVRMNPLAEADPEARERVLSEWLELIQNMLDPQREGMVGERFKRSITLVAEGAFVATGTFPSITDVVALILTKKSLQVLARAVRPEAPDLATRLDSELISLGEKEFADLVSWLVSRLQPFLRTPALREILGTGADALDVFEVMETGASLIVDLASLSVGEDVARVLGALWLLKVRSAMGRRTDRGRPIVLLIDEAHLYTFGALPGMLAEARKFGVGIVIATQSADNLSSRLAQAIDANCSSMITLRVGIRAALASSERLGGWMPTQLTRLEDLTAATSISRGGVPTPAFTLHVDHLAVSAEAGWSNDRVAEAADQLAEASRLELWRPHADRKVRSDSEVVDWVRRSATRPPDSPSFLRPENRTAALLEEWLAGRREAGSP